MSDHEDDVKIVSIHDGDWTGEDEDGGRWMPVGRLAGGTRLGCTLEEIRPGARPARYHYHLANEEALYVRERSGRPTVTKMSRRGTTSPSPRANRAPTPSKTHRMRC